MANKYEERGNYTIDLIEKKPGRKRVLVSSKMVAINNPKDQAISLREFEDYRDSGEVLPTKHGMFFKEEDIPALLTAIFTMVGPHEIDMVLRDFGYEINESKIKGNRKFLDEIIRNNKNASEKGLQDSKNDDIEPEEDVSNQYEGQEDLLPDEDADLPPDGFKVAPWLDNK